MKYDDLNILLDEASKLYDKIPIKEKTFMDISGYPHYENVSSNILAFYFNTQEEHNFKNLLTNSLIKVLQNKGIAIDLIDDDCVVEVFREYTTIKKNRIDIVLQSNDLVIGIENKLDSSVYNDLIDYAETLNQLDKNSIKILLSLHDNSKAVVDNEFINITYQELFNQLKQDLANYENCNNKWYIFINEFIKNLENYGVETSMEEEILKFLRDNKEKLYKIDELRKIPMTSFENKENELKQLLEYKLKVNYIRISKELNEITCYIDSPKKYHVDANLSYDGWRLGVFTWSVVNHYKMKQLISNSNYELIEDDGKHRIFYKYDYNTSIETILEKVIEIYNYFEDKFNLE